MQVSFKIIRRRRAQGNATMMLSAICLKHYAIYTLTVFVL